MPGDHKGHPTMALQEGQSITERAFKVRRTALLPSVSGYRYDDAWKKFLQWKDSQTEPVSIPNEEMLLVYLDDISEQFAASSSWTIYSMLKRQFLVSLPFSYSHLIDSP